MKQQVNLVKASVVMSENSLVSLKDAKEVLIAQRTNEIAQLQIEIDALKKYANYTENLDSLKLQVATLNAERNRTYDIYRAALYAYNASTPNLEVSTKLQQDVDNDVLRQYKNYSLVDENGEYYKKHDNSIVWTHGFASYISLISTGTDSYIYTYEEEDYTVRSFLGDSLYIDFEIAEDLRQFELDIEWYLDFYKSNLENATKNVTKYQRAYNGKAIEDDYENNGSTRACRNMVDSTAVLKSVYDKAADADKAAARAKYEAQLAKEQTCKTNLDNALIAQADAQLESDCFNKEVDIIRNFDTYNAALQAKIKARNEQVVKEYAEKVALFMDYAPKRIAWLIAYDEWDAARTILNDRSNGLNGASSIAQQIKDKEAEIAQKKAEIEDISAIESAEQYLDLVKGYLDLMNQLVAIQEINVQNAKADLEAAMAKYATAEE